MNQNLPFEASATQKAPLPARPAMIGVLPPGRAVRHVLVGAS